MNSRHEECNILIGLNKYKNAMEVKGFESCCFSMTTMLFTDELVTLSPIYGSSYFYPRSIMHVNPEKYKHRNGKFYLQNCPACGATIEIIHYQTGRTLKIKVSPKTEEFGRSLFREKGIKLNEVLQEEGER